MRGSSRNMSGSSSGGSRGRGPPARRSQYRVLVSGKYFYYHIFLLGLVCCSNFCPLFLLGLPPSGSWQDLKDHMREAGDVCFADVFKDGTGVVEFLRYDDMKYAFKKLDDSRFRSHEVRAVLIHAVFLIIFLTILSSFDVLFC